MIKRSMRTTQAGFAATLKLDPFKLQPMPNSCVADIETCFFDVHGNEMGRVTRRLCPIEGTYDATFIIPNEVEDDAGGQAAMLL